MLRSAFLVASLAFTASYGYAADLPKVLAEGPLSGYIKAIGSLTQVACVYKEINENSNVPWPNKGHENPSRCMYSLALQSGFDYALRVRFCEAGTIPDFLSPSEEINSEIGFSCVDGLHVAHGFGSVGGAGPVVSSRSKTPWTLNKISFAPWNHPLLGFVTWQDPVRSLPLSGPIGLDALNNPAYLEVLSELAGFVFLREKDGIKTWVLEGKIANPDDIKHRVEIDTKPCQELPGTDLPVARRIIFSYPNQPEVIRSESINFRLTPDGFGHLIPIPLSITCDFHANYQENGRQVDHYEYTKLELVSVKLGESVNRALLMMDASSVPLPVQPNQGSPNSKEY